LLIFDCRLPIKRRQYAVKDFAESGEGELNKFFGFNHQPAIENRRF